MTQIASTLDALETRHFVEKARAARAWRLARSYPLAAISLCVLILIVLTSIFAPVLAPYSPTASDGLASLKTSSGDHWFGTDRFGRDVLSRVLYGSRVSLGVGFMAVVFAGAVGVPIGLLGGYFGGMVDAVLMRLTDALMAIPGLLLALALILVLDPSVFTVALALGIGALPGYVRVVRSRVLSLRASDFVLAAHTVGASSARIIFRHILPNTTAPIIVVASLSMGGAVLAESGLSFLGVGVRPPTPTWGRMLSDSFALIYVAPWLMLPPAIAIALLILSLNLLGDGLRDILDPRRRGL